MLPHEARAPHAKRFPLLITTRLCAELPSIRRPAEAARIRAAIAAANSAARTPEDASTRRSGETAPFQVVHHTIQSNHLHLVVEARDRAAVASGMKSLLVRIARALNRIWKRKGTVFADRFHERVLRTPRQVRNALVYVLQNLRKHGIHLEGADPYSSGPGFDGWTTSRVQSRAPSAGRVTAGTGTSRAPDSFLRAARAETPMPITWLLGVGWQRHGRIDPGEWPKER